jgi:hypothetical protein
MKGEAMKCPRTSLCEHCLEMHEVVFTEDILQYEETLFRESKMFQETKNMSEKMAIGVQIRDFTMRNLIQSIEIATGFNFHETEKAHPQEQVDFLKANIHYSLETEGGKEFREKRWKIIWGQINSPLNKWGSGDEFKCKPDFFQRYCHYLRNSGLIKYWVQRKQEMDEEVLEKKHLKK